MKDLLWNLRQVRVRWGGSEGSGRQLARTDPDADPVEGYIQGKGAVPCSYSVLVPGQTGVVDVHESLIERTGATHLLQASGFTQDGNGDFNALLKSKLQV